jgi:uncharacterized membrane protein YhaH (DUF805 family)
MIHAFKAFWKNYFNFTDTSTRSEYWWVTFINTFMFLILIVAFGGLGSFQGAKGFTTGAIIGLVIYIVYGILSLIPTISLTVRRYRDAGVNPWWLILTWLVPFLLKTTSNGLVGKIGLILFIINILILILPSKLEK